MVALSEAWSHAKLRDPSTLSLLVRVFGNPRQEADRVGEWDRLKIVPLIFALLPEGALIRKRPDLRVKPLIAEHLKNLDIAPNDDLIATLKRVADNYYESMYKPPLSRKQKFGIEGIRALRFGVYSRLQQKQRGRCAVCGVPFDGDTIETLDHILPWRLAGDPFDGSNWQLLCGECNLGKREWLSALQSPQALNWVYGQVETLSREHTLETRYLALALAGKCQIKNCTAGPRDARLNVARRYSTGLPILDNVIIRCDAHLAENASLITIADSEAQMSPSETPKPVSEFKSVPVTRFAGYLLERRITSGGMAECFIAINEESGERVFLKRVREEDRELPALQREAEIYQKLERRGAEHTLRVVDFMRCDGFYVLVTEYAEHDLEGYVKGRGGALPTNESKQIVLEVIDGLKELHDAEIVHRDLKPGNILRCTGRWILADFGIAKDRRGVFGAGRTFKLMGTSGFAAPEQLLTGRDAEPAADVYALGKLMVFVLTGSTDIDRVLFRQWRRLIRECTEEDSEKRPLLTVITERLEMIDE